MRRFALLALLALLLSGCHSDSDYQPASITNEQSNEITEREKLVEVFGTAEVQSIPSNSHEFLARDTNGVIWYVSMRSSAQGRTRMFGWHKEFPKPQPAPTVFLTNAVTVTNTVTVTNYIVEDPASPK